MNTQLDDLAPVRKDITTLLGLRRRIDSGNTHEINVRVRWSDDQGDYMRVTKTAARAALRGYRSDHSVDAHVMSDEPGVLWIG